MMIPTMTLLRINSDAGVVDAQHKRHQRVKITGQFLAGPIKWTWLQQAARLPGKALHVAVALVFKAGMLKRRDVPMPLAELKQMGVERHAARRGLAHLERQRLVTATRVPGKKSIVRLPEVDAEIANGTR